jgi:hypothetical protein
LQFAAVVVAGDRRVRTPHALEDRSLRNHIEHFDERLDTWASSSRSFNFVDLNIMPIGAIQGIPQSEIFRQHDSQTNKFYFRGESFDIQSIGAGVHHLLARANERLVALRSTPAPRAG